MHELAQTMLERSVVPWPFELDGKTAPLGRLQVVGWSIDNFPLLHFGDDFDWRLPPGSHRTWGFRLHAWDFMAGSLGSDRGDDSDLRGCVSLARQWAEFARSPDAVDSMAWYDMALSRRVVRLTQLIRLAAESEAVSVSDVNALSTILVDQLARLTDDEMFAGHNNHGVYAAIASLFFAAQAEGHELAEHHRELGAERLRVVLGTQFLSDGGHGEHSPDYHRMLLEVLVRSHEAGLPLAPDTLALLDRASAVESLYVQPNGKFVQFGDTSGRRPRRLPDCPESVQALGSVSGGHLADLSVLETTGVAVARRFVRDAHGCRFTEHFALQAAFHSRVHKHADDLSVTWFAAGEEILVDSGKFGYGPQLSPTSPLRREGFFYTDPARQYVETTMAHNTVGVGDSSHDRVGRAPYGSAIEGSRVSDGYQFVWAQVDHGSWSHRRIVGLGQSGLLVVLDRIAEPKPTGNVYSAWWNVPAAWRLVGGPALRGGDVLRFSTANGHVLSVRQHAQCEVDWATGQDHPMRGWRSVIDRELEPVTSIRYASDLVGLTFLTSFSVNADKHLDRERVRLLSEVRDVDQQLL